MHISLLELYCSTLKAKKESKECPSCLSNIQDCDAFLTFLTSPIDAFYGQKQTKWSSRKLGMISFHAELGPCNRDTKSYDPVDVETLCILLDLRSEIALKHVVSVDSVLKRVDLGLSRSASSVSVASASLFREHDRYLFILDQLFVDAGHNKDLKTFIDEQLLSYLHLHLLDLLQRDVNQMQFILSQCQQEFSMVLDNLTNEVKHLISVLFHLWSIIPISFPHLSYLVSIACQLQPISYSAFSFSKLLILHSLLFDLQSNSQVNAVHASSQIHSLLSDTNTGLHDVFSVCSSSIQSDSILQLISNEFNLNEYGLAEVCMCDLLHLSISRSFIFYKCLIAMSQTASSIACLWPIVDSILSNISAADPLFDSYCEFLSVIASRSQEDTHNILLLLHQHVSSSSVLLETLTKSPTCSVVHLFGSLLCGLGKSEADQVYVMTDVVQTLFKVFHSHPKIRESILESVTPVIQSQSTADFILYQLIEQESFGETEPSIAWCIENDEVTAKAFLVLLSRIAVYASKNQILAETSCMLLRSQYLTDSWRIPVLSFVFSLLKSWDDSKPSEFLTILEKDNSFHHYLIQCIPVDSTSALYSLRLLVLLLHRPHTQFSQQNLHLLATFVVKEMDLIKPGSSFILHRLSSVVLLLLSNKHRIDWSQQDKTLLQIFRDQLPIYVELAYDGNEKWLTVLHTLIYLLHSSSGQSLLFDSDLVNCSFIQSLTQYTLMAIQTHYIRFLSVSLPGYALLSSTYPHLLSSFSSVFTTITQLIHEWCHNPTTTPLLSLLQFVLHSHKQKLIQEAISGLDLTPCFSSDKLTQLFLVACPQLISNTYILSHLSSYNHHTRSLCYLLLFKETLLPELSIPQLMRDASSNDIILSISAVGMLLRIIEGSEDVNAIVSSMMKMELEMSILSMCLEQNDKDMLVNHRESLYRVYKLERSMNLLEYFMQSPAYRSSSFKNQLCYTLSRPKNFFCFYPSIEHADELLLLPPPLSPEVLSPVQTRNFLYILLPVLHFAVSLVDDKDKDILVMKSRILGTLSPFVSIVFDPSPPYTMSPNLQHACQSIMIMLAKQVKQKKPLLDIVGETNPLLKLVN